MSLKRIAVALALASACLVRLSAAIVETVQRVADFAFALLARPEPVLAGNAGFTGLLVREPDYEAPALHALRHEAGTSRRSAARNI